MLSPQWLDELRSRITLSTLIGRTVKVTRAGREFKACCPFHNEKTPSFTINDEKGFYHCLAGDTVVMTRYGRRYIRDLAGTTASVLTAGGKWVDAPFYAYGYQRLWKVSLSRNGVQKVIHATDEHRWFTRGRKSTVFTKDLAPGKWLENVTPEKRCDWEIDPAGVRHGIVFGDGSIEKGGYGNINLIGEKCELSRYFPEQHHREKEINGIPALYIYGGKAFSGFKTIPHASLPDSYILGFLAGYLATDGCVDKDGSVMLHSIKSADLEMVRDLATKVGITTYSVTSQSRSGFGATPSDIFRIYFDARSLSEAILLKSTARERFRGLRKMHGRLGWRIDAVEPTERVEQVYCAEVPVTHAFALDDNILSSNCFGCSAHGDAIRWMTDQRGLSFMDAVKELAAEAGMEVPASDPQAAARAKEREGLVDINARAAAFFRRKLAPNEGGSTEPRHYLSARGISDAMIDRFDIGFAPHSRVGDPSPMVSAQHGVDPKLLEKLGLVKINPDTGRVYDFFRRRIIIPIHDARGNVIGFGGRILGDGEPKYLNSPDTPVFDKGRTLFNLHRAAAPARAKGHMLIVEGYMDVIGLDSVGCDYAVAPNGTALTEQQLFLAWKLVDVPTVCFDGDKAGRKAAVRAALRALPVMEPGRGLRFATPPDGKDPDDLAREGGLAAVNDMIAAAIPLVEVIWRDLVERHDMKNPDRRAAMSAEIKRILASIKNEDVRTAYRDEMVGRYRGAGARSAATGVGRSPRGTASVSVAVEAALALGIFYYPGVIDEHRIDVTRFAWRGEDNRRLAQVVYDAGADLYGELITPEMAIAAVEKAGMTEFVRDLHHIALKMPFLAQDDRIAAQEMLAASLRENFNRGDRN